MKMNMHAKTVLNMAEKMFKLIDDNRDKQEKLERDRYSQMKTFFGKPKYTEKEIAAMNLRDEISCGRQYERLDTIIRACKLLSEESVIELDHEDIRALGL